MKKICIICGKEYETVAVNSKFCSASCRKNSRRSTWERPEPKLQPELDLIEAVRRAKEAGMTYGQYIATYGGK